MIALLFPAAVASALAGPSFVAVSRVTRARPIGPLVRGSLERCCVLAAAGLAAAGGAAQLVWVVGCFGGDEQLATPLFFLLLPPALGAAPWVAGELLSGPSRRPEESFAAALATAYGGGAIAFGTALPAGVPAALAAAAALGAVLAALAYLRVRGGES